MNKTLLETLKPHLVVVLLFIALTFIYLMPLLQGKQILQHDINMWTGMSKEILDWKEKTGHSPLWTNSMFSGMPAYQISFVSPANLIAHVNEVLWLWMPAPAGYVFLLFLGFYVLMISLKTDWRLALAGGVAYAFCSYNFIIIYAGHNSKAHAIALMPFVIAGVLMTLRGKLFAGGALTAIALALQIYANHLQITYYLMIGILILMISEGIYAVMEKRVAAYMKSGAVLLAALLLAVLPNIASLWATYEYGQYSTRGPSELTEKKVSTGLDKDYALAWSYGKAETFTLLIPNFYGGPSQSEVSRNSALYKALQANGAGGQADSFIKNAPMYWGEQSITAGPTYAGAIVVFLFVFALFILDGRSKWWLLAVTVISVFLAWGKHFPAFTDIFFDHFPGYNKFRTVSMMLVLACFAMTLLAFLGAKKFFESQDRNAFKKPLQYSLYITGGLCLVFALIPGLAGDFSGPVDENFKQYEWLVNALQEDRASMLRLDAFRSLFFIAVAFAVLWFSAGGKFKSHVAMLVLASAVLVDGWTVSKRYLNDSHFVAKTKALQPFEPSQADQQILADPDPYYRVMNTTVSTFNDASTSYFHKSIGGYHGAKLKRYQELIEYQISRGNMKVLDMLNMKYVIQSGQGGQPLAVPNPGAMGNAWFAGSYKIVPDADAEMAAMDSIDPKGVALIDKRYEAQLAGLTIVPDSAAVIRLTSYSPEILKYEYSAASPQLAVFSDIYYPKGWNAYIDGKLTEHMRADYVLRAMKVPEGKHTVEFRFEPDVAVTGERIALAGSILLLLAGAGAVYFSIRKRPV